MQLDPQTGVSLFLPTPSARRATQDRHHRCNQGRFLPTPSVRRATAPRGRGGQRKPISTHALREEGDSAIDPPNDAGYIISTHALREEGDACRWMH